MPFMIKPLSRCTLLMLFSVITPLLAARADWPAHVFAPYMYLGSGDHFKLTECDDACGQKFYTLAFIIANRDGDPA